jgi:hypothetical protein
MSRSWAIAIGMICLAGSRAAAQDVDTLSLGIGTRSCAVWQSSAALTNQGNAWIYGFWTAMNFANASNHHVGAHTDGLGILAEVKKTCDQSPSELLNQAALYTYRAMEDK